VADCDSENCISSLQPPVVALHLGAARRRFSFRPISAAEFWLAPLCHLDGPSKCGGAPNKEAAEMAQVKIYGLRRSLEQDRSAISQAIHESVMEAFAYPVEKRFHRFIALDEADFIYPADRSKRYTIIEISIFEGRSVAAKKRLIRLIYEHMSQLAGITPQDVELTIFETPRHAWGIRGKPGDEVGLNYEVEV
jgi:phenylpyruvate tautomerase PptA (4-oxalocrotonate tautomerase family)